MILEIIYILREKYRIFDRLQKCMQGKESGSNQNQERYQLEHIQRGLDFETQYN